MPQKFHQTTQTFKLWSCPFAVKSLGQCCLTSYYLSVRNLSKKRKRQTKSRGFSLSVLLHPAQSTLLSETFPKRGKDKQDLSATSPQSTKVDLNLYWGHWLALRCSFELLF